MGRKVNVSIELDADIKEKMEQTCDVTEDSFYSDNNIRYLVRKMEDYKSGNLKIVENDLIEENV
ncbi:MAG: hypothetical protein HUJ56_03125 [Erysipelotrichaceae bacterium]|nr:hypothetical protein [Erysipelotrichaceae bacterium]